MCVYIYIYIYIFIYLFIYLSIYLFIICFSRNSVKHCMYNTILLQLVNSKSLSLPT